jgi:hypothetical protein
VYETLYFSIYSHINILYWVLSNIIYSIRNF